MRVRLPLVVVSAGLALAGCGTSSGHPAAVAVGADSDGKNVSLAVGQDLIVTLEADPTTGYAWALGDLDQKIVRQHGAPDYEQDPNPVGMAGVGGNSVSNFVAVVPGSTTLNLEYKRAWEQGVEPARRFTLNLTVH
ncbi:protease inhibitor I42 family protein [Nocardia niigatensis]